MVRVDIKGAERKEIANLEIKPLKVVAICFHFSSRLSLISVY